MSPWGGGTWLERWPMRARLAQRGGRAVKQGAASDGAWGRGQQGQQGQRGQGQRQGEHGRSGAGAWVWGSLDMPHAWRAVRGLKRPHLHALEPLRGAWVQESVSISFPELAAVVRKLEAL